MNKQQGFLAIDTEPVTTPNRYTLQPGDTALILLSRATSRRGKVFLPTGVDARLMKIMPLDTVVMDQIGVYRSFGDQPGSCICCLRTSFTGIVPDLKVEHPYSVRHLWAMMRLLRAYGVSQEIVKVKTHPLLTRCDDL